MTDVFNKDKSIHQKKLFEIFKDFLLKNYGKEQGDKFVQLMRVHMTDEQFLLLLMVAGYYKEFNDPELEIVIKRKIDEVLKNEW